MALTASGWLKDTALGPVLTATAPGFCAKSEVIHAERWLRFKAFASGTVEMRVNNGPGILASGEKKKRYWCGSQLLVFAENDGWYTGDLSMVLTWDVLFMCLVVFRT